MVLGQQQQRHLLDDPTCQHALAVNMCRKTAVDLRFPQEILVDRFAVDLYPRILHEAY